MSRLVLFKSNYEAQLKANVESGNTSAYNNDTFNYDEKQTLPTMFVIDDDICSKMSCDSAHEFEDAIILYDALKDIPDVMAADPTFWVSLSHTVFFPYLKKRWGKGDMKSSIINHWFFKQGMIRHGLGGLWWTVRLTIDNQSVDKYRLTKVAFWNYSFRTTFMGPSIFFRIKNARNGILKFLADHEELREGMENKGRFITTYFNRLGATKQLATLPEEYFYQEMERNIENMKEYNPRAKFVEEKGLRDVYDEEEL